MLAGALLVFGSYNLSIFINERVLDRGVIVRLELAPRDPRSLMTGDYMALRYALEAPSCVDAGSDVSDATAAVAPLGEPSDRTVGGRCVRSDEGDGFLVVALDARRVARWVRTQAAARPVADGEVALRYRVREARMRLGTDAWFFEEGSAARYEAARYGEYRVDAAGKMLLVRLLDERFDEL